MGGSSGLTVKLTVGKRQPEDNDKERKSFPAVSAADRGKSMQSIDFEPQTGPAMVSSVTRSKDYSMPNISIFDEKGGMNSISASVHDIVIAEENGDELNVDKNDSDNIYKISVEGSGKFTRKGAWEDIAGFMNRPDINKDTMKDIIGSYIEKMYPELKNEETRTPKNCYIRDEALKGITYYKDYDWAPVKLFMKPTGKVDIQEEWTKSVTIETFTFDYSTNLEKVLLEQGDKEVCSTLKKSKLDGHPLAMSMMYSESNVSTEFRGLDSTTKFALGGKNKKPDEVVENQQIWKDVKSLRALLKDKPVPKKSGKGVQRTVEVQAMESFVKARVYYMAYFKGEIVTDHGLHHLGNSRYWNFPVKDVMQYFDVHNGAIIHEDVELHFYTKVGYKMDNEDFEWGRDEEGKWIKKYYNQ